MDCCICSPMAAVYRLPRNAICAPCHEAAKAVIAVLDGDERQDDDDEKPKPSPKGMRDALEQLKEMRARTAATSERAAYLERGFALAWKEGIHTDILVKPGTGPPIPAHKAILASRSEVLRHALASDERGGKAAAGDTISLHDLSHDELALFLAFLYTGALEDQLDGHRQLLEERERHLHALLVAGDKYDVPFLRRVCEARLAARVEPRNVLRTLEVAELSGSAVLKERAVATVLEHAEQVVFSPEYHEFALRNASLCVEITRALLASKKNAALCTDV